MLQIITRVLHRLRGVHGETFISFRPWLTTLYEHFKPQRVLEFGPGWSTRIGLQHSAAQIVSIEESAEWYDKYRRELDSPRVELLHRAPGWDLAELTTLGPPFDLIFVDGGRRAEELIAATKLLAPQGITALHDAHREDYEAGIRAYPHIYFPERHGCIMTQDAGVMDAVRRVVQPDWSCNCKYCGTPARRQYFAQFMPEAAEAKS
jgi:hypothetical protein